MSGLVSLGEKRGTLSPSITAKEMPVYRPPFPQLEDSAPLNESLVSFTLGTHRPARNRNQDGTIVGGVGKGNGAERSKGEDRKSLWLLQPREPEPGLQMVASSP